MKKKYKIGLFSIGIATVISIIFVVTMNIGISLYIDQQCKKAIDHEIRECQLDELAHESAEEDYEEESDDWSDDYDQDTFDMEHELGLDNVQDGLIFDIDKVMVDTLYPVFVENQPRTLQGNLIHNYNIHKEQIPLYERNEMIYHGMKIYYAAVPDSDVGFVELIYVNPKAVLKIVQLLNSIFVIVMIVVVIVTGLCGINAGRLMEKSEDKLKRFFENASHELKTPLMSIQGYAEGIAAGVCPDDKQAASTIIEQSGRMESLVEEILLLSKLQSGHLKIKLEPINVCELMDSIIAINQGAILQRNIKVEIKFPDEIAEIRGDENQLYKALNAVFHNAVKYTEDSIEVSISEQQNREILTIRDNGSGIAKEDETHIFERFYYGKNGSTGVGLSLAKEIIEMHHGKIVYHNQNGTEFQIILPKQT